MSPIESTTNRRNMNRHKAKIILAILALLLMLGGCFPSAASRVPVNGSQKNHELSAEERFRSRPPINTKRNLYEGGLWRGAASWGNLMRDHRARYRGDLLTVTDMPKIINVPEVKPESLEQQQQAQQGQEQPPQQQNVDPVIAFLRSQAKLRERIDREQNEILRSIDTIEVEVARVLPNGNLLVRGVHPPIFRDRNRVKYVVTLQGIVRPSDVDANNQIPAPRLSKADFKIRRLVRRSSIPKAAGAAARAAGSRRGGEILDRLSNFLSTPRRRPPPQ